MSPSINHVVRPNGTIITVLIAPGTRRRVHAQPNTSSRGVRVVTEHLTRLNPLHRLNIAHCLCLCVATTSQRIPATSSLPLKINLPIWDFSLRPTPGLADYPNYKPPQTFEPSVG